MDWTQAGKFYISNPVSTAPTSLGQAGSGPGFQRPFSAPWVGASLLCHLLVCSLGELASSSDYLFPPISMFWPLGIAALDIPPKKTSFNNIFSSCRPSEQISKGSLSILADGKGMKFIKQLLDACHCAMYPICIISLMFTTLELFPLAPEM